MRLLLFIALLASAAHASLIKGDFLTAGDGLLVTDTATGYEWLSPVYTRNHAYNDVYVQSIESTYGFHYATGAEARSMMTSNFGNVTTLFPGDTAGFNAAGSLFSVFGITENVYCGAVDAPCPRTQGFTSQVTISGRHDAFGMIQLGSTGWMIVDNAWVDGTSDLQLGSWLIRGGTNSSTPTTTPEPASLGMAALGGLLIAAIGRRRRADQP